MIKTKRNHEITKESMWFSEKQMSKHTNQQTKIHKEKSSDMDSNIQQTICIKQNVILC